MIGEKPIGARDVGDTLVLDRDDDHPLVEDVIVLDVGAKRERRGVGVGVEEHGSTGDALNAKLARVGGAAGRVVLAVRC